MFYFPFFSVFSIYLYNIVIDKVLKIQILIDTVLFLTLFDVVIIYLEKCIKIIKVIGIKTQIFAYYLI